ncbi:hypothetical protein J3459_015407 [Metarhizium acridum]|nr:hypothetical protein J3459_015407 [Metarhizium acridum]
MATRSAVKTTQSNAGLGSQLPSSNPTKSYWQTARLFHNIDTSPDDTPARADVVIIGSGMTAAGVALSFLPLMASKGKAPVVFVAEAERYAAGRRLEMPGISTLRRTE